MKKLDISYRVGQQIRLIVAVGPDGPLVEEGTIREIEEDVDDDGQLRAYEMIVSTRGFKEGIVVSLPVPVLRPT